MEMLKSFVMIVEYKLKMFVLCCDYMFDVEEMFMSDVLLFIYARYLPRYL